MDNHDEVERWMRRAELYRRRNMPAETREAIRAATRIVNTIDLARGAAKGIVDVHKAANSAVRECPGAEYAIRDVEATVYAVLPTVIARYALG